MTLTDADTDSFYQRLKQLVLDPSNRADLTGRTARHIPQLTAAGVFFSHSTPFQRDTYNTQGLKTETDQGNGKISRPELSIFVSFPCDQLSEHPPVDIPPGAVFTLGISAIAENLLTDGTPKGTGLRSRPQRQPAPVNKPDFDRYANYLDNARFANSPPPIITPDEW